MIAKNSRNAKDNTLPLAPLLTQEGEQSCAKRIYIPPLNLEEVQEECAILFLMYIKLRVTTNARAEKIEKVSEDHVNIWVKEKPERNMANRRIVEMMRIYFKTTDVRIVSGHHSPSKIISV
ncbi:MAG: DUF167 domain-containing protein [Candidatus Taylorbacteria bacterium]|nr:DUF167 domain-containing protein [Candidatus Taylorbacteria bacterium]